MHNDVKEVLFSAEDLKGIVERLGAQITKDYEGKNLLLVCVCVYYENVLFVFNACITLFG